MAVPMRPAELALTALRPRNAPRIAVPKEMAVSTFLADSCSCSRATACSARISRSLIWANLSA
jgi:hypothetical protein